MSTATSKAEVEMMFESFKKQLASRPDPEQQIQRQLGALKKALNEEEIIFAFAKTGGDEGAAASSKKQIHRLEEQIEELETLLRGFRAGGLSTLVRDESNQTLFESAEYTHAAAYTVGRQLLQEDFDEAVKAAYAARQAYLESISHVSEVERDLISFAVILHNTRAWVEERKAHGANSLRPRPLSSFIVDLRVEDEHIERAWGPHCNWYGLF
ncbi:hypothetical protein SBDP1_40034 [Syntrophobacter sp. SbD1]|nr:hypothetical protein SBDP1_40034 [Syntrophobacter sp. SbD1]